jgi:hypothetical protein
MDFSEALSNTLQSRLPQFLTSLGKETTRSALGYYITKTNKANRYLETTSYGSMLSRVARRL